MMQVGPTWERVFLRVMGISTHRLCVGGIEVRFASGGSLESKGLDRIEARGLASRVETEEHADGGAHAEGERDRRAGRGRRPVQLLRDHP